MSKKYQITNSNTNLNSLDECTIFYILYIVLFFVIIFIIYKIIFGFYQKKENYENVSISPSVNTTITSKEILYDLTKKNKELNTIKDTLQNKLLEQSQIKLKKKKNTEKSVRIKTPTNEVIKEKKARKPKVELEQPIKMPKDKELKKFLEKHPKVSPRSVKHSKKVIL